MLYPSAADRLFGSIDFSVRVGGTHRSSLMSMRGSSRETYLHIMHIALCVQCRFLGSSDRECEYAPSLDCDMCSELRAILSVAALVLVIVIAMTPIFLHLRR